MTTPTTHFIREISDTLNTAVASFPVTVLTGPRQSGKTTLLKLLFPDRRYINLEDPDTLQLISQDIRGYLAQSERWIIDEALRLPVLFSYIQGIVDEVKKPGLFVLSGSQNFLLSEKISQTLAGRVAVLELLPLTYREYLSHADLPPLSIWEFLFGGAYPRPYQEKIDIKLWFNSYIRTYLERDVRSLINVRDLNTFQNFLRLCAGRHGQLLNYQELANDCGISQTTATHWINLLEASYILFRLQPYYRNFNKRIIKTPKLYFYDSALVCRLLGIEDAEHLKIHVSRGHIFEGFVVSEFIKRFLAKGEHPPVYFWRDHQGVEIDLVVETAAGLDLYELKSSATFNDEFLKGLRQFSGIAKQAIHSQNVIFTGGRNDIIAGIAIQNWDAF